MTNWIYDKYVQNIHFEMLSAITDLLSFCCVREKKKHADTKFGLLLSSCGFAIAIFFSINIKTFKNPHKTKDKLSLSNAQF